MSEYFDKNLIEEVLQEHYESPDLKITECDMKIALSKGENYASLVWRVNVHWQKKNQESGEEKLIVKTLPEGDWLKDMMSKFNTFNKETQYYKTVVPHYQEIFKKRVGGTPPFLGAKFYQTNSPDLLILEDLTSRGFALANRKTGGNFHHGLLVMHALARLHAFSIAKVREDPSFLEQEYIISPFLEPSEEQMEVVNGFFIKPMEAILEAMKEWPKFEKFIGKIKLFKEEEVIKFINNCGKLRVVIQGDCWINNMMFRVDDTGKPVEVCLLDFQMFTWGSLAFDLIYFCYTSLSSETLAESFHELVQEYIRELHKWLHILGEEIGEYTEENILSDIREERIYGTVLGCVHLNIMMAESEHAPSLNDLNELSNESGDYVKNRQNPRYQERLLNLFETLEKDGIL